MTTSRRSRTDRTPCPHPSWEPSTTGTTVNGYALERCTTCGTARLTRTTTTTGTPR